MNNTYILGYDNLKDPFIGCFNPDSMKLSKMKFPQEMKVHTHSSVLYYSINSILITGGVTKTKKITAQMTAYHPLTNKFTKLPDLLQFRYAHNTVALNGIVYIMGGRTYGCDFSSLTNSVESINLNTKEQKKCAPMIKRRCTFNTFVYQGEIYILGGYSGQKRTKTIEKYITSKNIWKKFDIKLQRGMEGMQIFSYRPDEIILIGGNTNEAETNCAHLINLKAKNIRSLPPMSKGRIMHKCSYNGNALLVFGGDPEGSIEKATFDPCWNWELLAKSDIDSSQFEVQTTFSHVPEFNFSSQTLVVSSAAAVSIPPSVIKPLSAAPQVVEEEEKGKTNNVPSSTSTTFPSAIELSPSSTDGSLTGSFKSDDEEIDEEKVHCFFGNDDKPFVTIINVSKQSVISLPCPMELRLLSYMGGCQLNKYEYFLSGGISSNLAIISQNAYIFNSKTNRARRLPKMNYNRYAHQCILQGDYVYVMGGRGYQGDILSLYESCQRYNLETEEWEVIGSLNEAQCSLNSFLLQNQVYAIGGYTGDGRRSKKIERYNAFLDEWEPLDGELANEIEASFVLPYKHNSILMFGGKSNDKDTQSIKEIQFDSQGKLSAEGDGDVDIASMKEERCLDKCIQLGPTDFLVFGGNANLKQENIIELVHLNQTSEEESYSDLCSKLSNSFQFMNLYDKIPSLLLV